MSFATECDGDGLDDRSQFHSPHAEDDTGDAGGSRSNCDTNLDVLSEISPTMIRVGGMYVNKKAL